MARKKIVAQAFKKLDKDGNGWIDINDVRGVYKADKHPDVVAKMNTQIKSARTASSVPDYNFPLVRARARNGNTHKKQ